MCSLNSPLDCTVCASPQSGSQDSSSCFLDDIRLGAIYGFREALQAICHVVWKPNRYGCGDRNHFVLQCIASISMSSHSPSHIISRPALRADEDDPIALPLHQKRAVKSQLIAALGTDPKLFCQINLDDIARSLHAAALSL
jgi:hypothetical protein